MAFKIMRGGSFTSNFKSKAGGTNVVMPNIKSGGEFKKLIKGGASLPPPLPMQVGVRVDQNGIVDPNGVWYIYAEEDDFFRAIRADNILTVADPQKYWLPISFVPDAVSMDDGVANTNAMLAAFDPSEGYSENEGIAQYCSSLGGYLGAPNEMLQIGEAIKNEGLLDNIDWVGKITHNLWEVGYEGFTSKNVEIDPEHVHAHYFGLGSFSDLDINGTYYKKAWISLTAVIPLKRFYK